MKQRTKENLGNIFGSLFSNQRAINGSKHNPWWAALIFFVLAIALPVIPITVNTSSTYGSQFLSSYTHGWENQITAASLTMYSEGYDFKVVENDLIQLTKDDTTFTLTEKDTVPLYTYTNTVTNQIDFQVYYSTRPLKAASENTQTVNDLVETIQTKRWIIGTDTESDGSENTETSESAEPVSYYRPSYLLIYQQGIYAYLAKPNSTESVSAQGGDWKNIETGTKLLESVLTVKNYELPTDADSTEELIKDANYMKAVDQNWRKVFDNAYLYTRNSSTLTSSLIFLGVYAALTIFMGLMIFLLTRGKKNNFNYLTFWACLKIEAWAALSPGILGLILGFILPNYAMMFFIIFLGLRTMWITTKQLRPTY